MEPILSLSGGPEPEARGIIGDGLNAYNDAIVGYADRTPLTVKVCDPDRGAVIYGMSGGTSGVFLTKTFAD